MRKQFACVRGKDSTDCGPAALATVALHFGLHVTVTSVRELVGTDLQGTSLADLAKGAIQLGFEATAGKARMGALDQLPVPAIVHFQDQQQQGHFVVLHQVGPRTVTLADPAKGIVQLSRDEFSRHWSQKILLLTPSSDFQPNQPGTPPFRQLLGIALRERSILAYALGCGFLLTVLGFGTSFFVQSLIDRVIPRGDTALLPWLGVGTMVLLGFRSFYGLLRNYLLACVEQKIGLGQSLDYIRHVLSLPMSFFDQRRQGDIFSRLTDVRHLQTAITNSLLSVLADFLTLIFLSGFLAWYNLKLTLLTFGFLALVAGISLLFQRPLHRCQLEQRENLSEMASGLIEAIANIRILKVFTAEQSAYEKIQKHTRRYYQGVFRQALLSGLLSNLVSFLIGLVSVLILWIGSYAAIGGGMSLGKLMFFSSVLGLFLAPVDRLVPSVTIIQEALVCTERLAEVKLIAPEGNPNSRHKVQDFVCSGEIIFRDVSFWYREGLPVLSNVNLLIPAGQTVAIVGETGCGKTSLTKLLTAMYEVREGQIFLDGFDLQDLDLTALRSQMGIVFQDPSLSSGTIFDNIALGNPAATLEQVQAAARLAEAHDFITAFPKRYHHEVGDYGSALSSGQRQRIALARALLNQPRILILDEATSNLDSETEQKVMNNIRHHCANLTIIMITHRLTTVAAADEIIVLDQGRVIESGKHAGLLAQKGKYARLWQAALPRLTAASDYAPLYH